MSRGASAVVDFFLVPASLWALAAVAVGHLVDDGPVLGTMLMIGFILFAMIVLSLEAGVKAYYAIGRRKYFYAVFLPPTILTVFLLLASLAMS